MQENIYFQDHFSRRNPFPKTHLQTTMSKRTSQADMKGKFISGLPYFFAQKVRLDLANNDDGTISSIKIW